MTSEPGMIVSAQFDKEQMTDLKLLQITIDLKTGHPILGEIGEAKRLLEEMKSLSPKENFILEGTGISLRI
jgi:hypothetical protein